MKYYLYILETIDNTLYCGVAKNPISRFLAHKNKKGAKYTKIHEPKSLLYVEEFKDKKEAMKEEYRIKKTFKRIEKLELIKKYQNRTKKIITGFLS